MTKLYKGRVGERVIEVSFCINQNGSTAIAMTDNLSVNFVWSKSRWKLRPGHHANRFLDTSKLAWEQLVDRLYKEYLDDIVAGPESGRKAD